MGFIYKITNKINNKIYIGKTTRTVEQRYKEHLADSKRVRSYLHNAIQKYGSENFNVEKVEEVLRETLDVVHNNRQELK